MPYVMWQKEIKVAEVNIVNQLVLSGWQLFSITQLVADLYGSLQMVKRREKENFWVMWL